MSIRLRTRRVALGGLLVAAPSLALAPPAGAVSATVNATCKVTAETSLPPIDLSRIEVRVNGGLPTAVKPGEAFSLEGPSLRLFADPTLQEQRPRTGQYTARLERATITTAGALEPSADLKEAPLDLGTIGPRDGLLRWLAPASGTYGPIGPFTASSTTRKVNLSLAFRLRISYVDPNVQTFAPVGASLDCATDAPFASVPVYRPATGLPTVAKVLPNRAPAGSWVTVYGRRLDSTTSVSMFGATVPYEIVSSTTIRAQVPSPVFAVDPGPFLPLRVRVANDLGTSADTRWDDLALLYHPTYSGPAVTSVTPSTVSTQTTSLVWLEGSFLKGATKVTIAGEPAPFVAINDSRIAVQTTPRPAGTYGIGVTAAAGTMPDAQIFVRYQAPPIG